MKNFLKSCVIITTLLFTENLVASKATSTHCVTLYRTTFQNNSGLPIQVTAIDSTKQSYTYMIGNSSQQYLDLKTGVSPVSLKVNAINKQGQPVIGTLNTSLYVGPTKQLPTWGTRTITFKSSNNQTIIDMYIQGIKNAQATTTVQPLPPLPASVTTPKTGDYQITIQNSAQIPMTADVTDLNNEQYLLTLAAGAKKMLYFAPPNCLKNVKAISLQKQGEWIGVSLNVNLACANRSVTINDSNDHKDLFITVVQGKGLPNLTATSDQVNTTSMAIDLPLIFNSITSTQVTGSGSYNAVIQNETGNTLSVVITDPKTTTNLSLLKNGSQTILTGCVQKIEVGTQNSDGSFTIDLSYANPLTCAAHKIEIKPNSGKLALVVDGKQVAVGASGKALAAIQQEATAAQNAAASAGPIQDNIFVYKITNNADFPISLITLTDTKGTSTVNTNFPKNSVWTPQVGCISSIVVQGTNSKGQLLQVSYQGALECTQHKININDANNHTELLINLVDTSPGKTLAKSLPLGKNATATTTAAAGTTYTINLQNSANFAVVVSTTDISDKITTYTLPANTKSNVNVSCIKNITATGTNIKGSSVSVNAQNLTACPQKTILINDDNNHTSLTLKVDGKVAAQAAVVKQNELTIVNQSSYTVTVSLVQTDDTPLGPYYIAPKNTSSNLPVSCIKQIFASAPITLGGKQQQMNIAAAVAVPCNQQQKIVFGFDTKNTLLQLMVPGAKGATKGVMATSQILQNNFTIKNSATFAVAVTIINDTGAKAAVTIAAGKSYTTPGHCITTIAAQGTNSKGQNIAVQVSPTLACDNHTINISSLNNATQLRINVDGQPLATSATIITVTNSANFTRGVTLITTDSGGKATSIPIGLKKATTFAGGTIKLAASGINNAGNAIVTPTSVLVTPISQILVTDDNNHTELVIKVDNKVVAQSAPLKKTVAPTATTKVLVQNSAAFAVSVTLTSQGKAGAPINLGKGQSVTYTGPCITAITASGTTKKGFVSLNAAGFACPTKHILVNDANNHSQIVINVDSKQVAKSS